jgi:G:T-mismatch repair DNA endonuclease (very short patch repair protein)
MLVIPVKAIGTGLPEIFGAHVTLPGIPDVEPDAKGFIFAHACFWTCLL